MEDLLREAAARALRYRQDVQTDPIRPDPEADIAELGGNFPDGPLTRCRF